MIDDEMYPRHKKASAYFGGLTKRVQDECGIGLSTTTSEYCAPYYVAYTASPYALLTSDRGTQITRLKYCEIFGINFHIHREQFRNSSGCLVRMTDKTKALFVVNQSLGGVYEDGTNTLQRLPEWNICIMLHLF